MNFPPLPPLDDLNIDDDLKENNNDVPKESQGLPGFPDLPDIESSNNNNNLDDDYIEPVTEAANDEVKAQKEEIDNNDFYGVSQDDIFNEDFSDIEEIQDVFESEEEYENFDEFLPTVTPMEEDISKPDESKPDEKNTVQNKKNKENNEFKEIDEEAIKEFFSNLKSKIFNKSQPKKKTNKIKDGDSSNKITKLAKIIGLLVFSIMLVILLLKIVSGGGKPLSKFTQEVKVENGQIIISNLERNGDGLSVTFTNDKNYSSSFFVDILLETGGLKKESFKCQSDILFVEANQEIKDTLKCLDFIEADKYKIKVNLNEIK